MRGVTTSSATLIILAVTLVPPLWANITVGQSLGVWWAPLPVWAASFLIVGLPEWLLLVVPPTLFLAVAVLVIRSDIRTSRRVVSVLLALSSAVLVLWAVFLWSEGVMRAGYPFVLFVNGAGLLLLVVAGLLLRKGWSNEHPRLRVAAVWVMLLWASWLATPWMLEAI